MIFAVDFVPVTRQFSTDGGRGLEIGDRFDKFVLDAVMLAKIYKLPVRPARKNEAHLGQILDPRGDAEKINLRAAPFQIIPDVVNPLGFSRARIFRIFRLQVFG